MKLNVRRNGWCDKSKELLAELWPTHSGSEIAEKLQTTKNSVQNQAKRLNLCRKERFGPFLPAELRVQPIAAPSIVIAPERRRAGNDPLPALHPISWGALQ